MNLYKGFFCLFLALSGHSAISQNTPLPPLQREVTLQVVNEPVSSILRKIEKQAQVTFSYNSNIINDQQRISATFNRKTVEEIIVLLFDGKIECKAKNDHVILTQGKPASAGNRTKEDRKSKHKSDSAAKNIVVHDTIIKVIRDTVIRITHDTVIRHVRDSSEDAIIQFGISAGLNLASADISGSGFTKGGNGGVFVNIRLTDRLSFRQELLFTVKGYKYSATEEIPPYTLSTSALQKFYYVEIPFLLKANINPHFSALCGTYAAILLNAPFTTETSVNGVLNHRESGNSEEDLHAVDLGISAGLGYDLSKRLNLGVKYSRGITNLNKDAKIDAVHHSGVSFNIAFKVK